MLAYIKWGSILIGVLLGAALLSITLLYAAGGYAPAPCSDFTDECMQQRQIAIDRSTLVATTIGVALSAIGTVAILVTILLSYRATNAAIQAVRQQKEISNSELRPYLVLNRVDTYAIWGDDPNSINWWRWRVWWTNTGTATALEVRSQTNYLIIDGEIPQNYEFPDRKVDSDLLGTVGNGKEVCSSTNFISPVDLQKVIDKKAKLFVYSWIDYECSHSSAIYRTEFCCRLDVWNGPATANNLKYTVYFTDRFNGSDRRAMRKPAPRPPIT